jgi:AraC family transcriptional regulator
VNAQPDTFAGLLAVLAADLDDHEARAEDRAARLHLSRYHFDRVIRATAGEPPAAFRRRILMERAAFRLATSRDGVLRLAVDAGYSSNEAFTRAFQRAYGVAPSAWRARPGQIQLDSPNDVHFHPPGGLRLPGVSEVNTMNLLIRMVEHHLWLVNQMVDLAAKVDDATLDREITLSVEQLDDESVVDIRARLDIAGPAFLAEVRRVVEGGRLDETFIDAQGEAVEVFTYGGLIAHVLTFAAHRRILVLGALESAGIPDLGNGDPRLWVAEGGQLAAPA